jgi:hypothetical protein
MGRRRANTKDYFLEHKMLQVMGSEWAGLQTKRTVRKSSLPGMSVEVKN